MTPESPANGPERREDAPENDSAHRFNPFVNEEDMFRVVLWVGATVLVLIVLVALVRALT